MKFSIFNFQFSKILGISVLVLFFLFSANYIYASCSPDNCPEGQRISTCCPTEGIVPCGTVCCPCTFCDIFVLIDNIIDFVLFKLILPIAALMFIIGGFFMLTASGNPELFNRAKSILTATIIGLVIIFTAFIFIGTFFQYIGLAEWTENIYQNWWQEGLFEFSCD